MARSAAATEVNLNRLTDDHKTGPRQLSANKHSSFPALFESFCDLKRLKKRGGAGGEYSRRRRYAKHLWRFAAWHSGLAAVRFVFRQRLDQIVKTEPEAPTVMIKADREDQRDDEQEHQHGLVVSTDHEQHEEAEDKDHQFSYDHIRQNRAHEEAVFALVEREAFGAVVADVERPLDDRGLAAGRATQLEAAFQYPNSLFLVEVHSGPVF